MLGGGGRDIRERLGRCFGRCGRDILERLARRWVDAAAICGRKAGGVYICYFGFIFFFGEMIGGLDREMLEFVH